MVEFLVEFVADMLVPTVVAVLAAVGLAKGLGRWRWRAKPKCMACGYDMRERRDLTCTECGVTMADERELNHGRVRKGMLLMGLTMLGLVAWGPVVMVQESSKSIGHLRGLWLLRELHDSGNHVRVRERKGKDGIAAPAADAFQVKALAWVAKKAGLDESVGGTGSLNERIAAAFGPEETTIDSARLLRTGAMRLAHAVVFPRDHLASKDMRLERIEVWIDKAKNKPEMPQELKKVLAAFPEVPELVLGGMTLGDEDVRALTVSKGLQRVELWNLTAGPDAIQEAMKGKPIRVVTFDFGRALTLQDIENLESMIIPGGGLLLSGKVEWNKALDARMGEAIRLRQWSTVVLLTSVRASDIQETLKACSANEYLIGVMALKLEDCGDEDLAVISRGLKAKTINLDFKGDCRVTDDGLGFVGLSRDVESVWISGAQRVTERFLEPVAGQLKDLGLIKTGVTDEVLELLDLSKLEVFELTGRDVGEGLCRKLANVKGLTKLKLQGVSAEGLQALAGLPPMTVVSVIEPRFSEAEERQVGMGKRLVVKRDQGE